MIFHQTGLLSSICHLYGLVIFRYITKNCVAFSADQLIIQKRKLDISITKPHWDFELFSSSNHYLSAPRDARGVKRLKGPKDYNHDPFLR